MEGFRERIDLDQKIHDYIEEARTYDEIYIFGAGSYGKSVYNELSKKGVKIEGMIVDHEFFSGKDMGDVNIIDFFDFKPKGERVCIVIGMSDMKRGLEIEKLPYVDKVVYPTGLSMEKEKGISSEYISENIEKYSIVYDRLADSKSRDVLVSYLNASIARYNPIIFPICEDKRGYFNNNLFEWQNIKCFINVGAYNGDTIDEFNMVCNGYKKIYAIEGDEEFLPILRKKYESYGRIIIDTQWFWDDITGIEVASWSDKGTNSVGRYILEETEERLYKTNTLDNYFMDKADKIDLISVAIRGQEKILVGGSNVIRRDKPILVMKVGFDRDGIIRAMETISNIHDRYSMFLRYKDNKTEEMTLYAVPDDRKER